MTNSGSARPKTYKPRIVDAQVQKYLALFGAVEVSGTKWSGKTWTSLAHGNSVTYVDRGGNLQISAADPTYPLIGERPHVIDEWQRVPAIWDAVRHGVDELGGERGAWILTGSSTPRMQQTSHSGAGRIGRIRMHPMTLQESGESSGAVSLRGLFEGAFAPVQAPGSVVPLCDALCRGGWPAQDGVAAEDALLVTRQYLEAIFTQSVPLLGGTEDVARRLCASLARNLGQAAKTTTLAADTYAVDAATEAMRKQVAEHLDILKRLYLVDEVPGWVPAARSPKRLRTKAKLYFADPSLPVALLGLSPSSLIEDGQTLGLAFESLCMRDLQVYAQAMDSTRPKLCYYRDDAGLEADAVIERPDGSWGAFEVKLSGEPTKVDAGAQSLLRLRNKLCGNEAARVREPRCLCVLTGTGEAAYRRPDGVLVVPIRTLGA